MAGRKTMAGWRVDGDPMSFRKDNKAYEAWLATQCEVVKKDIKRKHQLMEDSAFMFLRATYFRWARKIGDWSPELMNAPKVLAIGDLHLENFGTWRDADGRFVWGVNDFDEAAVMPYVLDLVRLATSIRIAPDRAVDNRKAAAMLIKGYLRGLQVPQPALLDEGETWLRPYAIGTELETGEFWDKLGEEKKYPLIDGKAGGKPPREVIQALNASLPKATTEIRYRRRIAGGGSLGRPRYVAIADWHGGGIPRGAKKLGASAWAFVDGKKPPGPLERARSEHRAPGP